MSHYQQRFPLGPGGAATPVWPGGWHWVSGWQVEGIEVARWRGQAGVEGPGFSSVPGLAAGFVLRGLLEHAGAGLVSEGEMMWGRMGAGGDWSRPWRTGKGGLEIVWAAFHRSYLERFVQGVGLLPVRVGEWLKGGGGAGGLLGEGQIWARATEDRQSFGRQLASPPVLPMARDLWYRAKATELLASVLWPSAVAGGDEKHSGPRLDQRVVKARRWIREHLDEELDLTALASTVHASPAYLSRLFHKQTGRTLMQERRQLRIARAKELMSSGRMNVSEAAVEVGYRSLSQFGRAFAEETGCSPGEWIRGRR